MTATTTPRRAVLIGTTEVTFTPYTIRRVGEVRPVVIDGVTQDVIFNPKRKLTYFVLNGVPGRIAAELVAGCAYDSFIKGTKPVPAPVAPVAPKAKAKVAHQTKAAHQTKKAA